MPYNNRDYESEQPSLNQIFNDGCIYPGMSNIGHRLPPRFPNLCQQISVIIIDIILRNSFFRTAQKIYADLCMLFYIIGLSYFKPYYF